MWCLFHKTVRPPNSTSRGKNAGYHGFYAMNFAAFKLRRPARSATALRARAALGGVQRVSRRIYSSKNRRIYPKSRRTYPKARATYSKSRRMYFKVH